MSRFVLDASALLLYINQEAGSSAVESCIEKSSISTVNLCEVLGKLRDIGMPEKDIDLILKLLPCKLVDFDEEQAKIAAAMKSKTSKYGLSLGDRACLALASMEKAIALTADRAWAKLGLAVKVRVVR